MPDHFHFDALRKCRVHVSHADSGKACELLRNSDTVNAELDTLLLTYAAVSALLQLRHWKPGPSVAGTTGIAKAN